MSRRLTKEHENVIPAQAGIQNAGRLDSADVKVPALWWHALKILCLVNPDSAFFGTLPGSGVSHILSGIVAGNWIGGDH